MDEAGLLDSILRMQFERICPTELLAQFKIHKVCSIDEMAVKADAHFEAFGYSTKLTFKPKNQKKNQHASASG